MYMPSPDLDHPIPTFMAVFQTGQFLFLVDLVLKLQVSVSCVCRNKGEVLRFVEVALVPSESSILHAFEHDRGRWHVGETYRTCKH